MTIISTPTMTDIMETTLHKSEIMLLILALLASPEEADEFP